MPEQCRDVIRDGERGGEAGRFDAVKADEARYAVIVGPWITKSGAGAPGPAIFGRMPV